MASPSAAALDDDQPEKVSFKFCPECSNMLYPSQDKINQRLMYICRTCKHNQPAESACISRNVLGNTVGETAGITQDVGSDPTVSPLPCMCTLCGVELACARCGQSPCELARVEGEDVQALQHSASS